MTEATLPLPGWDDGCSPSDDLMLANDNTFPTPEWDTNQFEPRAAFSSTGTLLDPLDSTTSRYRPESLLFDSSEPHFDFWRLSEWDIELGSWFDNATDTDPTMTRSEYSSNFEKKHMLTLSALPLANSSPIVTETMNPTQSASAEDLFRKTLGIGLLSETTARVPHKEQYSLQAKRASTIRSTADGQHQKQNTSSRAKKRLQENEIPGTLCFSQWIQSSSPKLPIKKARIITATQQRKRQKVKESGACLRCRIYKLSCSLGRPCDRCEALFNAAAGRRNLQWRDCISTNLQELNLFGIHTLVPDGFRFTTNRPITGDDLALRDCIPLLLCLSSENKWWTPNMCGLFSGALAPYFSLVPKTILRKGDICLSMERAISSSHLTIQYETKEPIKLKEDFVNRYKDFSAAEHLMLLGSLWRAWCAQFGLRAIQRCLSRHELARMSKINLVRLFVILTSLLKTISNAKIPFKPIWSLFTTEGVLTSSELRCRWDRMRTHLLHVITYNLRLISSRCFAPESAVNSCFVKSRDGMFAHDSIFFKLDEEAAYFVYDHIPHRWKPRLRDSALWHWNENMETWILDMPLSSPSVITDFYSESCLDSKTCSKIFEDLAFAFAGCTLGDLIVDRDVPVSQTFESYNGIRSRVWTVDGDRLPYSCNRMIVPPPHMLSTHDKETGDLLVLRNDQASDVHCGSVFSPGDIQWQCYTCGSDLFCDLLSVLCHNCYVPDNHVGHDVKSLTIEFESGAFCDCGDPTAWRPEAKALRQQCDHNDMGQRDDGDDLRWVMRKRHSYLLD